MAREAAGMAKEAVAYLIAAAMVAVATAAVQGREVEVVGPAVASRGCRC